MNKAYFKFGLKKLNPAEAEEVPCLISQKKKVEYVDSCTEYVYWYEDRAGEEAGEGGGKKK